MMIMGPDLPEKLILVELVISKFIGHSELEINGQLNVKTKTYTSKKLDCEIYESMKNLKWKKQIFYFLAV